MTAISSWMIACISFVSLALMEYAMILLFKHVTSYKYSNGFGKKMLSHVDSSSLLIFITAFVIFNSLFWDSYA